MRLRKHSQDLTLNIVAGTSAVLFSIDMVEAKTAELLGFYIRKENLKTGESYDVQTIRHFPGAAPAENGQYSTKEHPWQSFLWEDFYVKDKGHYRYHFTPVYGRPDALRYGEAAIAEIQIPSRSDGEHEVYFNRGVAGSQAYAREFGNKKPDAMNAPQKAKALKWLSRGLEEAMIAFVKKAKDSNWQLRGCFYEFIYPEVLAALKAAHEAGADVKIIYDARHEAAKNDAAIKAAGLSRKMLIRRTADPEFLQHNKYMILLKNGKPMAVWTGSTNLTEKAIFGHCNVGHVVRNEQVAGSYLRHWNMLKKDPVAAAAKTENGNIQPDLEEVPQGVSVFFSPRPKAKVLGLYSRLIARSEQLVCGMFPFSFSRLIKAEIKAATDHLKFVIIDKKDKNTTLESDDFDNVIVYGGKLEEPLYGWAEEKSSGELLYNGVNYIHNKVILVDPLSEDPVVISGSANFSDNSVLRNDENTLVIRGNRDVADLYFTEFARIFNHYSARQDINKLKDKNHASGLNPAELRLKAAEWAPSFFKSTARKCKRRKMFSEMKAKVI